MGLWLSSFDWGFGTAESLRIFWLCLVPVQVAFKVTSMPSWLSQPAQSHEHSSALN
jgi:hypothetical protein